VTAICLQHAVPQVSFDAFIPYISVVVDGVPANVAGHMARLATIDFALRSHVVRRTMWAPSQTAVRHYPLEIGDCYTMVSVSSLSVNEEQYAARAPAGQVDIYSGCWFAFEQPCDLYIGRPACEDRARGLEVNLIVAPGQDSCTIDQWVYQRYAEPIAAGALARLFRMPSEPWYDLRLAKDYANDFDRMLTLARAADRSGYSSAPMKLPMPKGFLV
jgi:hypothetical protein